MEKIEIDYLNEINTNSLQKVKFEVSSLLEKLLQVNKVYNTNENYKLLQEINKILWELNKELKKRNQESKKLLKDLENIDKDLKSY